METIIVSYKGSLMIVYEKIAKEIGITWGYNIKTEEEFWKILTRNAAYGLTFARMQMQSKS